MKEKKSGDTAQHTVQRSRVERRLKLAEHTATFGLLVIAVGLMAPFGNIGNEAAMTAFKWIYACGAIIYTVARLVGAFDPSDTFRIKRLRRMEVWAGFAFCIGAFFWFYNAQRWAGFTFGLKVMSETVTFTLVGAIIQIIASWMLSSALRKRENSK